MAARVKIVCFQNVLCEKSTLVRNIDLMEGIIAR